jgi:hypothetical protein
MTVRVPIEVVSQKLGSDVVVLHLGTGVYWSLNETGAAIWQELVRHGNPSRAVSTLGEQFAASEAELRQATDDLVAKLLREGLLETAC